MFFCPCHDDGRKSERRSLAVTFEPDGNTKAHCFACASAGGGAAFYSSLAEALNIPRDSFSPDRFQASLVTGSHDRKGKSKVVSTHVYQDASGQPVYKVERRIQADGQGNKFYWQYAYVDCRFRYFGGDKAKPEGAQDPTLYNLPAVLTGIQEGQRIYVVEGEKSADILNERGLIATTNAGGAGKWKAEFGGILAGADVVILPDNDQPGERHAVDVAASLKGHAKSVKQLTLPGLNAKEDVYDWLSGGHSVDELSSLADSCAEFVPEVMKEPANIKLRVKSVLDARFTLPELMQMPDKGWYLEGVLAPQELVMIAGPPAIGKTFLGLDMAASLVLGTSWGRQFTFAAGRPLRVDYFLGEGISRMNKRINALLEAYDTDLEQLSKGLTVYGGLPRLNETDGHNSVVDLVNGYRERKLPIPDVVFIDTFARATSGADENSARDAGRIINAMDYLKDELGCTVIVVHHTGKNGDVRGSSAFAGGLDVMLKTVRRDGTTYLTAEKVKDGELFEDIPYSVLPIADSCFIGWGEGNAPKKVDAVLEFLRSNAGQKLTLKEIHEGCQSNKSSQTVRNHLKALVESGKAQSGTREDSSKAAIWWVPELKPGTIRIDFSHVRTKGVY